ncbi:MAG: hypothetical protein R3B40_21885 [Polyangiales bacterium]
MLTLVEIHDGDVFYATDRGWLASGGFRAGEGMASYAHAGPLLLPGSVMSLETSALGWSAQGDQVFLWRGPIDAGGSPTGPLLEVLQFAGPFAMDATSDTSSALPPALNGHATVLAPGASWSYTGPTTGTRTALRTAVRDASNWTLGAPPPSMFTVLSTRGEACEDDARCLDGFCVDSVCCDARCGREDATRCGSCNWGAGHADTGRCLPLPAGATCRSATDLCDAPELCDGSSTGCPADAAFDTRRLCRFGTGPCDPTDYCDGVSFACPPNQRLPAGAVCRDANTPCDAPEVCDGLSARCPPDAPAMAGVVCRAAATPCDETELCDGASWQCPLDSVADQGTECRAAADVCDVSEFCDGVSADCPNDVFLDAGVECRAAVSVSCDVPESCTGDSPSCPVDARSPEGQSCVAADTGVCAGPAACQLGACAPSACDDGDSCTVDVCDAPRGCSPTWIPGCCHQDSDCVPRTPCEVAACGAGERCVYTPVAGCERSDAGLEPGAVGGGACAVAPGSREDPNPFEAGLVVAGIVCWTVRRRASGGST